MKVTSPSVNPAGDMRHGRAERWRKLLPHARSYGLAVMLVLAIGLMAIVFNAHFSIQRWLIWRYAGYWSLVLGWCACCTAAGFALVQQVGGPGLPLRERLVLGCAAGVLVFVLAWFLLGIAGQFNVFWFALCPLALAGVGIWTARASWRRIYRHRRLLFNRQPTTALRSLLVGFGLLGLVLAYLPIVTPLNLAFDAHWYHVRMAEMYGAARGIFAFREGWMMGAYPQLATLLYSWAFMAPRAVMFDCIEISAHLEFVLFLATLASVALLVRRVLPRGTRAWTRWSWTAMFLFPELFLYDSSLTGGADHVAAFWAAPLFLALLRARRELSVRNSILLGLMTSGVLLTKYTAYGLLVFPALWVGWCLAVALVRNWSRRRWVFPQLGAAAALLAVILACTTPHWLKNLVWYGDPLFPWLHRWFEPGPWTPEGESRIGRFLTGWRAEHSWQGVKATLLSTLTFSFIPNDWTTFHRDWPVFGSLFSVTTPLLLLLKGVRRLVVLYAAVHVGILYWYWTFHQDRYLQAYLPWMAAGVAAVIVLVWQAGWLPRILCSALIGLQLGWGGDAPFFPTHAMAGTTPLKNTIDFFSSGFTGTRKKWFKLYGDWADMNEALPKDAKLLLHECQGHLGLRRVVVSDWFQTGISYVRAPEPDKIHDLLRGFGVTHVLWTATAGAEDTVGSDLAFFFFATRHTKNSRTFGAYTVAELPSSKPSRSDFKNRALYLGCNDWYESGLYRITDLTLSPFSLPAKHERPAPLIRITSSDEAMAALSSVDALLVNPSCFKLDAPLSNRGMLKAASRATGYELWVRQR